MKKRLLKVVKVFFIVLGVLFLTILLLSFLAFYGAVKIVDMNNFPSLKNVNDATEMKPIIKYIEGYKRNNGKYPQKLENFKLNKNIDYKYEVSSDSNCYSITLKYAKENKTQLYQHCSVQDENSNSSSESFSEFSN